MKKIFKSGIAFLLAIVFIASLFPAVGFADDLVPSKEPESNIQITAYFEGKPFTCTFPYSDSFFEGDQDEFNLQLAKASFGLMESGGNDRTTFLEKAAFENIEIIDNLEKDANKCSFVVGSRKIGDKTVVAVSIKGLGYPKAEWAGNFTVGDGDVHEGFREAADFVEDELNEYIGKIDGDKILWITGFSRTAAITNIVAADYTESGDFDKVFAYDFATPTVVKQTLLNDPTRFKNIFNLLNKDDVMPGVPLESWGFMRNGVDKELPVMEVDPVYALLKNDNSAYLEALGFSSRTNPNVNFHLHMLLESLAVMFPTNEYYADNFQDALTNVIQKQSVLNILNALLDTLIMVRKQSWVQKEELLSLINYVALMLKENHEQDEKEGLWDPKASLQDKYFHEHQVLVYNSWLMMDDIDNFIYSEQRSREFGIRGNVDVTLYSGDDKLVTVLRDGTVQNFNDNKSVIGRRKGYQTVFILPKGLDARVEIVSHKAQEIVYLDITTEHDRTFNTSNRIMYSNVKKNVKYMVPLEPFEPAGKISRVDGKKMGLLDTIYFSVIYRPSLVMDFEYYGEEVLYKDFDSISEDDFETDLQNYLSSPKPEIDIEWFVKEDTHVLPFIEQLIVGDERITEIEGVEYDVVEVFAEEGADNPKTGDNNWIWYVLFFSSIITIFGLAYLYIKKHERI